MWVVQRKFKLATGFSGSTTTIPMNDMDWERLIRERPAHYLQLEKFKEAGGFPHAELCSLIKGTIRAPPLVPIVTSSPSTCTFGRRYATQRDGPIEPS